MFSNLMISDAERLREGAGSAWMIGATDVAESLQDESRQTSVMKTMDVTNDELLFIPSRPFQRCSIAWRITCRQTTQYFCEPIILISANKSIEQRSYSAWLLRASLFAVLCAAQSSKWIFCNGSHFPLFPFNPPIYETTK